MYIAGLKRLQQQARVRRRHAFRPGTTANHRTMFTKYIRFCKTHNVAHWDTSKGTLCAYLEHLTQTFKSSKSVKNYFGAINLLHKFADKTASNSGAFEVTLMLRASGLTMRQIPHRRQPITPLILHKLCTLCKYQGAVGAVLRLAYILAFLGFFRASNLCPYKEGEFDITRHLSRADVTVAAPGLVVDLKWSKTLQQAMQPRRVPIVRVRNSPLDAVQAFGQVCDLIPAEANAPLFLMPDNTTLTVSKLRGAFNAMLKECGLSPNQFGLHSFRRGGATCSHDNGANYIDIKRQGQWAGPTFWDYVAQPMLHKSSVCNALFQATKVL